MCGQFAITLSFSRPFDKRQKYSHIEKNGCHKAS